MAKRLVGSIKHHTNIPAIDYLFNEEDTPLPDLGGIQATLAKRTRHRRALMRMLFDYHGTDRLIICLDTASIDLMQDFFADRSTTRLLEMECVFTDEYLAGHARRVGLAGEQTGPETLAGLLPTIRYDVDLRERPHPRRPLPPPPPDQPDRGPERERRAHRRLPVGPARGRPRHRRDALAVRGLTGGP